MEGVCLNPSLITWLVIGFGSELHGDDRFGRAVADALEKDFAKFSLVPDCTRVRCRVISANTIGPEMVAEMAVAGGVIFVDASAELVPGQLSLTDLHLENTEDQSIAATNHHCSPRVLLSLCSVLYPRTPPAWLMSAGGANFNLSENMTPLLSAQVNQACKKIVELICLNSAAHSGSITPRI